MKFLKCNNAPEPPAPEMLFKGSQLSTLPEGIYKPTGGASYKDVRLIVMRGSDGRAAVLYVSLASQLAGPACLSTWSMHAMMLLKPARAEGRRKSLGKGYEGICQQA